jgi:hypothetical protein
MQKYAELTYCLLCGLPCGMCVYTFVRCRYGAGFECYKSRKFEEAATHLQGLLVRPRSLACSAAPACPVAPILAWLDNHFALLCALSDAASDSSGPFLSPLCVRARRRG